MPSQRLGSILIVVPRRFAAVPALALAAGCAVTVPSGVRKVDTAALEKIPAVVTSPAEARTAAAANATPATRRTLRRIPIKDGAD